MSDTAKTIGVFFGGKSPEHDVSIVTGQLIISELQKMGRNVLPVYIGQNGSWYIGSELGSLKFFTAPDFKSKLERSGFDCYQLDIAKSKKKLVLVTGGLRKKTVAIDLAIPALHGQNGEDGTLQGLFEMFEVAYVGCGVTASAIAINKVLTKDLYRSYGIETTPYLAFREADWKANKDGILSNIRKSLKGAVFIKPARLGSSIGISKVKDPQTDDLQFKIEVALHYDNIVLVEEAVENLADITCAVLGGTEPKASLLQESRFERDLLDFKGKYLEEGGAQLGGAKQKVIIPAEIPVEATEKIRELSLQIFKLIGASGIARVDWLYDKVSNRFFANEINTMPGTLYHHLWKASGLSLSDVISELLKQAQLEQEQKLRLTQTFNSTLLAKAGSLKLGGKFRN